MATGKLLRAGDDQAVLLPKEFQLSADEVEITRQGRDLVLKPRYKGLAEVVDIVREFPDDMIEAIAELKRKDREGSR